MRTVDLFWPMLEPPTDEEKRRVAERRLRDLEVIQTGAVTEDLDVLIEEARRLSDLEHERRKTAETKAALYLTFVGVLAPILGLPPQFEPPVRPFPQMVKLNAYHVNQLGGP